MNRLVEDEEVEDEDDGSGGNLKVPADLRIASHRMSVTETITNGEAATSIQFNSI